MCGKSSGAGEGGCRAADKEAKEILNVALPDRKIQRGGLAMAVGSPRNAALCCDGGVNQGAGDFFEDDVTVGAVDHRMECGMEW